MKFCYSERVYISRRIHICNDSLALYSIVIMSKTRKTAQKASMLPRRVSTPIPEIISLDSSTSSLNLDVAFEKCEIIDLSEFDASIETNRTFTIDSDIDLDITALSNASPLNRSNYVSPFVTVKRGKGSKSAEKVKRDNMYQLTVNQSIELPVEVRRTKEACQYFRGQLKTEVNRLLGAQERWTHYAESNSQQIDKEFLQSIRSLTNKLTTMLNTKLKKFLMLIDDYDRKSPNDVDLHLTDEWEKLCSQIEPLDDELRTLEYRASILKETPKSSKYIKTSISSSKIPKM